MLLPVTDALNSLSPSTTPITVPISIAAALFTPQTPASSGSFAAGGAPVPAADTINAITLQGDPSNPAYILLGSGTPSATNYHFILPANGLIVLGQGTGIGLAWRGGISAYNPSGTAAVKIAVCIL